MLKKMSSDLERSFSSDSIKTSDNSEDSGQKRSVLDSKMSPYEDEPLVQIPLQDPVR